MVPGSGGGLDTLFDLGASKCLACHLKPGRRAPSVRGCCYEHEGASKCLTWLLPSCVRIGTSAKTDAN